MIGTSTGEQYPSDFDYLASSYHAATMPSRAPTEPVGEFKSDSDTQVAQDLQPAKDQSKLPQGSPHIPTWLPHQFLQAPDPKQFHKSGENYSIDREHHVPLVASALTDDQGKMYGMAIDSRIPSKPEYEKHLWNHEAFENDYMNDLVKNGMSSQDAYHKAHDWSTARESAAVTAEFGEKGLEDYKQHWRDAAAIAAEPSDKQRHPDAHTTKHGLDESELGKSFQIAGDFVSKFHPIDPMNPAYTNPGGHVREQEFIHEPAIISRLGKIYTGDNHGEAYRNATKAEGKQIYQENGQGFTTSRGRYVNRKEAAQIAKDSGQIKHEPFRGELTSEDLDEEYVKQYMQPEEPMSNWTNPDIPLTVKK